MRQRFARLSTGERTVLVAGILLIADLVLLPWHSVDLNGLDLDIDTTRSGVQNPNSGYGIAAVVLTALMIDQILVSSFFGVRLREPPVPWSQIQLIFGVFVAVVLVVKLIRETEFLGYGAYSAILAGVLVAYGGLRIANEAGVVEGPPPGPDAAGAEDRPGAAEPPPP